MKTLEEYNATYKEFTDKLDVFIRAEIEAFFATCKEKNHFVYEVLIGIQPEKTAELFKEYGLEGMSVGMQVDCRNSTVKYMYDQCFLDFRDTPSFSKVAPSYLEHLLEVVKQGTTRPDWTELYAKHNPPKETPKNKVDRLFGMLPSKHVDLSEVWDDGDGKKVQIEAGSVGWTIIFADASTRYADISQLPSKNLNAATETLLKIFPNAKKVESKDYTSKLSER